MWAVENGHSEVVRTLLKRSDVDPNISDTESGSTPLLLAVMGSSAVIVGMLLERPDTNPNLIDTEF